MTTILSLLLASSLSVSTPSDSIYISKERLERLDSADYYISTSQWLNAERVLKEALRLEPASRQNALLLSNLGTVQMEMGRVTDAMQSYSTGLCITPNSTVLLTKRGALSLQTGSLSDAVRDFEKALAIDSTLLRPRLLRGIARMAEEDLDGAESDLRIYIEKKKPEDDYAIALLGRCMERKGNRAEGKSLMEKAVSLRPDAEYYYEWVRMMIIDEEYEKAREKVQDAIISFPDAGMLYLLRGYIHKKRFRPTESMADREIALRKGVDKRIADAWLPEK